MRAPLFWIYVRVPDVWKVPHDSDNSMHLCACTPCHVYRIHVHMHAYASLDERRSMR